MVSGACVGLTSAWTNTARSSQFYRKSLLLTRSPVLLVLTLMPTNAAFGVLHSNFTDSNNILKTTAQNILNIFM